MSGPPRERAQEDVSRLVDWFRREGADLPWRRTRDRYRVLVAEAQLQATPVARVVPYYLSFVERWPTPADLAAARLGDGLAAGHGLGYPRRARNLHAAARLDNLRAAFRPPSQGGLRWTDVHLSGALPELLVRS